jgi:hypothetical protein
MPRFLRENLSSSRRLTVVSSRPAPGVIIIGIISAVAVGIITYSHLFIHNTLYSLDATAKNPVEKSLGSYVQPSTKQISIHAIPNNKDIQSHDSHHDSVVPHNEVQVKVVMEKEAKVCRDIKSLLDISKWPDIVFYEDHPNFVKNAKLKLDPNREENLKARATVAEFNRIRKSVLTTDLLDEGINEGSLYTAQKFAQRFLERGENDRPLTIAVTGNSFTIGSNCGENTRQGDSGGAGPDGCGWPYRLAQRWEELVTRSFGNTTNTKIEWNMLQANGQASQNIVQRLPSLIDEYDSINKTLDVIILNNGIIDLFRPRPWFEAVIRVIQTYFPQTMIINLIDGTPEFVSWNNGEDTVKGGELSRFRNYMKTHDHYNIARLDLAKMCLLLKYSDMERYRTLRQQYPESSLLWPQVAKMMYGNKTTLRKDQPMITHSGLPLYWANYTPRVEKTKVAYFPTNHPPFTTHQYVADSVLYTLLRLLKAGIRCDDNNMMNREEIAVKPALPKSTIAKLEEVERCFVCLKPIQQLDARVLESVVNGTNGSNELSVTESHVVVTCGDWKWITDERKRSGWQSDKAGSLIRFRLKVSSEVPILSLTYMTSHTSFGDFHLSFVPVSKANINRTLMGCSDVTKFENQSLLPSMILKGKRPDFSLWDTFVFSGKLDSHEDMANEVMKKTVMDILAKSKDIEFIDVYVLNNDYYGNQGRVKIQTVTSC